MGPEGEVEESGREAGTGEEQGRESDDRADGQPGLEEAAGESAAAGLDDPEGDIWEEEEG